jgi:hypothetical protein
MKMELITDVLHVATCDTFTVSANSASVEQLQLAVRVDPCIMSAYHRHQILQPKPLSPP